MSGRSQADKAEWSPLSPKVSASPFVAEKLEINFRKWGGGANIKTLQENLGRLPSIKSVSPSKDYLIQISKKYE